MSSTSRAASAWLACDVVVVLVFVVIGRHTHHHRETLRGAISTAWPFGVGLFVGWVVVLRSRARPSRPSSGVIIWLSTVAIGMVLRVISGQGTAVAFVCVALGFLGLFMLGARGFAARSRAKASPR